MYEPLTMSWFGAFIFYLAVFIFVVAPLLDIIIPLCRIPYHIIDRYAFFFALILNALITYIFLLPYEIG